MRRQNIIDDFFYQQPDLLFIEELKKPYFEKMPQDFCVRTVRTEEADVNGLYLVNNFPDAHGLLISTENDFAQFSKVFEISGDRYPVYLEYEETKIFESYTINTEGNRTVISAADTEGIRRGVIQLEDMIISAQAPVLPLGCIRRSPWLKSRVTRGFFSPTNRPPKNIDELYNDEDYYPDNYLVRLMHDGTNGLWIYTKFMDLLPSPVVEEYGKESERRIQKLNKIIKKCAGFGIKVYVFSIEPAAFDEKLHSKYPDIMGHKLGNQYCCCPAQAQTEKYLYESGKLLASLCPDLGGVICLTAGERLSSCASVVPNNCPVCGSRKRGEILGKAVELLEKGLRETNPEIEFVSWTYGHREWKKEDISDYVKTSPDSAYLMQNFDDYGFDIQLKKPRMAIDYWLSYVGPSELFEHTAIEAERYEKKLWAKMQICCSHELASLPYIPSPLHVYKKLKGAKKHGVKGVVECWYFGNYPSIMSKACGMLAFEENFSDEKGFLKRFASVVYGGKYAEDIAKAWQLFYKGYSNYPTNIMFSYYGPMHDGVVWELSLKPKNFSLPRSWQLPDRCDGDRIHECLMYGHTLGEAIILVGRMQRYIARANALLSRIDNSDAAVKDLKSVSNALYILSSSGKNILEFYKLRGNLGREKGAALKVLESMKKLVGDELSNSTNMMALCQNDTRLGYHSEAEGYKFFPKKLEKRIETLKTLLTTEFTEVEKRIYGGLKPLEYYEGIEEGSISYKLKNMSIEQAYWQPLSDGKSFFRMSGSPKEITLEIKSPNATRFAVMPEFDLLKPTPGIYVYSEDGHIKMPVEFAHVLSMIGKRAKKERNKWQVSFINQERTHVRFVFDKAKFGIKHRAFKMAVSTYNNPWIIDSAPVKTLGKDHISPGEYGWVYYE